MKAKQLFFIVFLAMSVFVLIVKVQADTPLQPPADYWISSQNNKFQAFFDVKNKITTVYKVEKFKRKEKKEKMWQMEGWFRNTFLSNDGKNLVVAYNGANLLALNYKVDEIMISFYDQGNLLNQIRLNQLIENPLPENLERTASHFKWVSTYGINSDQVFEVNTIAKKQFLFDLKTGLPIGTDLYSENSKLDQNRTVENSNQDINARINNGSTNANSYNEKPNAGNCQLMFVFVAGLVSLVSYATPEKL